MDGLLIHDCDYDSVQAKARPNVKMNDRDESCRKFWNEPSSWRGGMAYTVRSRACLVTVDALSYFSESKTFGKQDACTIMHHFDEYSKHPQANYEISMLKS